MASQSNSNKTVPNRVSPKSFIAKIEHPVRKADAKQLLPWFTKVTGYPAVMWGDSMIGYGRYHYEYASGRSGDSFITGFAPRKASLSVYIMPGYRDLDAYLSRLGKHNMGKSCLYINKLADIDMDVLAELVQYGVQYINNHYNTWKR